MHLDFVHQDWVCSGFSAHPLPQTPLFPGDELNCTCSDEVYVMNWNWRNDPKDDFEPLPSKKQVIIDASEQRWVCPENHEHALTSPILRSMDDLICGECSTQFQFRPVVRLPDEIMERLDERAESIGTE